MNRTEVTEHIIEFIHKTFATNPKTETICGLMGCFDAITFNLPITEINIFVHKNTEIGISYSEGVVHSTTYFFADAVDKIKEKLEELCDKMVLGLTSH